MLMLNWTDDIYSLEDSLQYGQETRLQYFLIRTKHVRGYKCIVLFVDKN